MDTADLHPLVDELSGNIDDLEESLAPIIKNTLSHSTSKLPLLDKAKLHVLVTYAIESILFSYLRLNGVEAKSHPVFQELARVKEYFGKIKSAENAGAKRSTVVDKDAAARFVKHGLAGNEKYDQERAERIAREKAGAKRKFEEIRVGTHTRFDQSAKRIKASEEGPSATATENEGASSDFGETRPNTAATESSTADVEAFEDHNDAKAAKRAEKQRRRAERKMAESANVQASDVNVTEHAIGKTTKKQQPSKSTADVLDSPSRASSAEVEDDTPKKRKKKRKSKAQKIQDDIADEMK